MSTEARARKHIDDLLQKAGWSVCDLSQADIHGAEMRKPIPSYQIYSGSVFELVDQALDFALPKIDRAVGTRDQGPQAPVTYELPQQAVAEDIVNAVAHRDYASLASVQVMLIADRLEIWNPGELPAPEFRQDGGQFVQTMWSPKPAAKQTDEGMQDSNPGTKQGPSRDQVKILEKASSGTTLADLMKAAKRTSKAKFREYSLRVGKQTTNFAANVDVNIQRAKSLRLAVLYKFVGTQ